MGSWPLGVVRTTRPTPQNVARVRVSGSTATLARHALAVRSAPHGMRHPVMLLGRLGGLGQRRTTQHGQPAAMLCWPYCAPQPMPPAVLGRPSEADRAGAEAERRWLEEHS